MPHTSGVVDLIEPTPKGEGQSVQCRIGVNPAACVHTVLRDGRKSFPRCGAPDGEARRSPMPPLDQLRAPPARDTLFAPQRARLPSCRLDIVAATLCAARRKCSKTAER